MQLVLPLPDLVVGEPSGRPSREQRVFVNRSLRFDQVEAVGFDMDYTLALYRQSEMDRQSVEASVPKMVALGNQGESMGLASRAVRKEQLSRARLSTARSPGFECRGPVAWTEYGLQDEAARPA